MNALNIQHQVEGLIRLEAFHCDESGQEVRRRVVADWFPNLVLDQGLNLLATSAQYLAACQVGSGSTPPVPGQSALVSRVAGTTTLVNPSVSRASAPPYYVARRGTYRFAQGVAAGNIAEIGIGTAGTGSTLFSRALVKDPSGAPTTITVLADESLDVIYEFRYYAPESDVTGTIAATGNIGGEYAYTLRAANVTDGVNAETYGWSLPANQNEEPFNNSGFQAFSGGIGPMTGSPSGAALPMSRIAPGTYAAGSFRLDREVSALAPVANISGGIRSMLMKIGIGTYQIEFAPPIPKTATDVVQLTIRLSWERRP